MVDSKIDENDEFEEIIRTGFKKVDNVRRSVSEHCAGFERLQMFARDFFPKNDIAKIFHVAGTNGKGSVCAMLDSVYRNAGYHVGLYISPALLDIRERIQLDRKYISKRDFCRLYHTVTDLGKSAGRDFSIFTCFTLIALLYFQEANADVIILETGVGGRSDSTNIVDHPTACIITSISFDHENVLGRTLPQIAYEKAGIIKEGARTFIGSLPKEAEDVILNTCHEKNVPMYRASHVASTNLVGDYQKINASVVYTVASTLRDVLPISDSEIEYGLMHAFWPARNQQFKLKNGNVVIFDGGHNSEAADIQKKYVSETFNENNSCLIFSSTKPAHAEHFLANFYPYFSKILLCNLTSHPHKIEDDSFFENLVKKFPGKSQFLEMKKVIETLCSPTDKKFFVTGSLYLIGEVVRELINAGQMDKDCFNCPVLHTNKDKNK